MKNLKNSVLVLIFVQLTGCSTNPVQYKAALTHPGVSASILRLRDQENAAAEKIRAFADADLEEVILPYMFLVASVNEILGAGFEAIDSPYPVCLPKNVAIFRDMYALNASSLLATSLLAQCEVGDRHEQLKYLVGFHSILEVMLRKNDGRDVSAAIEIREVGEANLILAALNYTALDQEIVQVGNGFVYRVQAIDNITGKHRHLYFDNFGFVKRIYPEVEPGIGDARLSSDTFNRLLVHQDPAALNSLSRLLLADQEYSKTIELLEKVDELSFTGRLQLAKSYFYLGQDEKLDRLLVDLADQKDMGDVEAAVFLAELVIERGSIESIPKVTQLLADVDRRTNVGFGAYSLAINYDSIGNDLLFDFWAAKAINLNRAGYYSKLYQYLESKDDRRSLYQFVEKQHLAGNSFATYDLALVYHKGFGVEVDHEKERDLFLLGADAGHPDSMYELGYMYQHGLSVKPDWVMALHWYEKASAAGNTSALNQLGQLYYDGKYGIAIDYLTSWMWMKKASEAGVAISTGNLGRFYEFGLGVEKDLDKAVFYYKSSASAGYLQSYVSLGNLFQYNLGSDYYLQAARWYEEGASQGHALSQYKLASIYAGQLDDPEKALHWYDEVYRSGDSELIAESAYSIGGGKWHLDENAETTVRFLVKAARLGDAGAQVSLGFHYETGNGVVKSMSEARQLYEQSAEQGNGQGINNLGTFYRYGYGGLPIDLDRAFDLYSKSSNLGNGLAHKNLARMYFHGEGTEVDFSKAYELFVLAENAGFAEHYFLGVLHFNGEGVALNYLQAKKYFELSVAEGVAASAEFLGNIHGLGLVGEKDPALAIKYFAKVAELDSGIPDTDFYIAGKFHSGDGVDVNFEVAREYYEKSVRNNNAAAMNNLAELFRLGQGVEIDYQKAVSLYLEAADLGEGIAMFNLAELFRDGHGVGKNPGESFYWAKLAAENGFVSAYTLLSDYYLEGFGVDKDISASLAWLGRGVEAGYPR